MSLSKKQLAMRAKAYGASEIAALLGYAKWARPIEVYERKVKGPPPEVDSLPQDLGNLVEEPVAQVYAKRTGLFVARVQTLEHPAKPLALATPDRACFRTADLRGDPRRKLTLAELEGAEHLAQIKLRSQRYRYEWGEAGTDDVPDDEGIQVQWEMGVTGKTRDDLVVFFLGDFKKSVEIFPVRFRPQLFEGLYELVSKFHTDHVLAQVPPPPDASERYAEVLNRLMPDAPTEAKIVADADLDERLLMFAKILAAEKRLKGLKALHRDSLLLKCGNAKGIESKLYGGVTHFRTKDSETTDWQRAGQEALLLAAQLIDTMPAGDTREQLGARLKAIVPGAVKAKPGYHVIRGAWRGEAKWEVERLELALDRLKPSEEEDGEESEAAA